jgi:hypothetical protein
MRIQAALCGRVQQLRCEAHDAAMELESLVDEEGPPKALPSSRFVL